MFEGARDLLMTDVPDLVTDAIVASLRNSDNPSLSAVISLRLTKVIRVRNKDNPLFNYDCRHAFDLKQEAHLWWTRDHSRVNCFESIRCQVRANEVHA